MDDLTAILKECERAPEGAVLATVVHVQGSAYRRPGARMLILRDGRTIGTISGGCLEGDIARKARWLTESGQPVVQTYDTTSGDDAVWEFGLGCNGVIQVLLERVDKPGCAAMLSFLRCRGELRSAGVVATVIRTSGAHPDLRVGQRLFLDQAWNPSPSLMDTPLWRQVLAQSALALREERSRLVHLEGCEVFVEFAGAPQPMVIFGAGHDAIPVAAIGRQFGWNVTVADGRPQYANPARFPGADRVVVLRPGNDPLNGIVVDSSSAVVLMTHNYPLDAKLLPSLLAAGPRYLGILGPRARSKRLFDEMGRDRIPSWVHAPIGLDLGSDNPLAIAVAICGEIQAVIAGRDGGMLRHRDAPIHSAVAESGYAPMDAPIGTRPLVCESTVGSYV